MEIYETSSKDAKALLEALLWARDWATERRCTAWGLSYQLWSQGIKPPMAVITEAPAQSRMQLLQQLLTLISCCCNKLRVGPLVQPADVKDFQPWGYAILKPKDQAPSLVWGRNPIGESGNELGPWFWQKGFNCSAKIPWETTKKHNN